MNAEPISRREFLRSLGRLAGLGFLAWIAASVGLKAARGTGENPGNSIPDPGTGETCGNEGWCRPCPVAGDCGLPRALSYRQRTGLPPAKGS